MAQISENIPDSASTSQHAEADSTALRISDLQRLAESFEEGDQPFLSYAFHLAHYELTADSSAKLGSGLAALNGAFSAERYTEAEHALNRLAVDFPEHRSTFQFQLAYLLLRDGRFDDADSYLNVLGEHSDAGRRLPILRAYSALNRSDPFEALAQLERVDTDSGFSVEGAPFEVASARLTLQEGFHGGGKSPVLAGGMSAFVPGLGQLYTGHTYDAIQAFTFTTALGYGAYTSWRHELGDEGGQRTFILPALVTVMATVFYVSNVRGAAASATRANTFAEAQYFRSIIERLDIVLADEGWFLGVRLEP